MSFFVNSKTPSNDPARVLGLSKDRAAGVVLGILLAIHACQCVLLFPSLSSIMDREPVIMVDHAIHLYHGALGSKFLLEHGTTWGFDPYFMAGYPETPVWDSSSNPSILFQSLAGGGYQPRAYKLGLLAFSWLALALAPLGARKCGCSWLESAIAALCVWVYFWVGFPSMFWRTGLFSFVSSSSVLLLVMGLVIDYGAQPSRRSWLTMTLAGAFHLFLHVTSPLQALGGAMGFVVCQRRRRLGWWLSLGLSALLVLAINVFWLAPFWRFRDIRSPAGVFMAPGDPLFLLRFYLSSHLDGYLGILGLLFGTAGLLIWWSRKLYDRAWVFTGSAILLFLLAAFGGLGTYTRLLEPLRFLVPLQFLLAAPAATALIAVANGVFRFARRGWLALALVALVALAAAIGLGFGFKESLKDYWTHLFTPRPLVVGVKPEMKELLALLTKKTDFSARILFEDQLRLLESKDPESTHWTTLLPFLLAPEKRQFIGGEYQMAFIKHHASASFGDFSLASRPIDEFSPSRFGEYCRLYNIGWVVCWSPLSRFYFDRLPMAKKIAVVERFSSPDQPASKNVYELTMMSRRAGEKQAEKYLSEGEKHYVLYRIDRPRSFVIKGKGELESVDFNRVVFKDLVPRDGVIQLSLHWSDAWRTDPPLTLGKAEFLDVGYPFIEIRAEKPIKRLVIETKY